ncbi:MAG: carboxypeptidase-like regulatory domain-containing protein [Janthinobacterium lividum]
MQDTSKQTPPNTPQRTMAFCLLRAGAMAALLLQPLHAQYTRNPLRTITGTVTDAGTEPLRGAVVQIEATDTLVIQSYVTDEAGAYHFRNLRSDADYTIWATFRGNRSKTHGIGKFDHKLDRDIPITIVLEK